KKEKKKRRGKEDVMGTTKEQSKRGPVVVSCSSLCILFSRYSVASFVPKAHISSTIILRTSTVPSLNVYPTC
ncbi:hypothetical protein, partial [Klebsiella pneumoniae]|uniref:hypothetical protein n=1 Tax=Klebsiella pneumoniae TaxID=573 RepID=UPI0024DDFFBA